MRPYSARCTINGWCFLPSSAMYSSSNRAGRLKSNCTVESCHGAPDGVHQLHVDLRAVERGFVGHHLRLHAQALDGALQRVLRPAPTGPALPSYLPLAPPSQVESSASYWSKPKVSSVSMANCRQSTTSSSICSGVQKMCASSCVKPRTRNRPLQHAGALVAVHRAQFAQAHRQVAIAALPVRVDQDVERAVHGLELVFGVVQLHAREHVLRVETRRGRRSSTDRSAPRAACRPANSRASDIGRASSLRAACG